jgi:zinc transport system substrate-binding protein
MIRLLSLLCALPVTAVAQVPQVITDIAPIHSLTAQVMGDLGTPDLLLPPGADPHDFALRPSDATRLGDADLVIWVGEGLTPWLAEPLATLAPAAQQLQLLDTPGWAALDVRDDDDDDDGDDHDHDHGEVDPHAWLDPVIAQTWVTAIAAELALADPENAAIYEANALTAQAVLEALGQELTAHMAALTKRPYVLPHDGYQYFEVQFGLTATAAIAGIDARTPGPAQVAELRDGMDQNGIVCVFSDAEIGARWAALVIEGTNAKTATLDGVGLGLDAGPALYDQMMRRLAGTFSECLS